jgi:hypothetical protein
MIRIALIVVAAATAAILFVAAQPSAQGTPPSPHPLVGKTCLGTYETQPGTRGPKGWFIGGASFRFFERDGALFVHTRVEGTKEAYENPAYRELSDDRGEAAVAVTGNRIVFKTTAAEQDFIYDATRQTLAGQNSRGATFKTTCK